MKKVYRCCLQRNDQRGVVRRRGDVPEALRSGPLPVNAQLRFEEEEQVLVSRT